MSLAAALAAASHHSAQQYGAPRRGQRGRGSRGAPRLSGCSCMVALRAFTVRFVCIVHAVAAWKAAFVGFSVADLTLGAVVDLADLVTSHVRVLFFEGDFFSDACEWLLALVDMSSNAFESDFPVSVAEGVECNRGMVLFGERLTAPPGRHCFLAWMVMKDRSEIKPQAPRRYWHG